ncbi:MAG TPA: glycoside hydrolase [Burkholderiaceae bacterium]
MAATSRSPVVAGAASSASSLHPAPVAPPTAAARTTVTPTVAPGANTSGERKYAYVGGYDTAKMADTLTHHLPAALRADNRWDSHSLDNLQTLMSMIEADTSITDLRWVAYMLATAYWETNHVEKIEVPKTDRKGAVMKDKVGNIVMRKKGINVTLAPVNESGQGKTRNYARPVKVAVLPTGEIQVTEYDGDQFIVSTDGKIKNKPNLVNSHITSSMGTAPTLQAVRAYKDAAGDEHVYYGRGYVQLTWWSNYATAGPLLGLPAAFFLQDPEQALEASYAYKLMSLCMRTGAGFANKHKFENYFSGHDREYQRARAMVNGTDHAAEIANIARDFEDILWDARKVTN